MRFDTWRSHEFLKHFRREAPRRKLIPLKYPDLPDLRSARDVIAYAEKIAPRIVINDLDYLYSTSTVGMEREKWEREVRIAFCIDHIITDIRPQERADIISKVEPPKGLLLTFHGGFVQLLVYWLQSHGAMIASRADDNANLLFSMLRTLQDGGTVLMAPDARFGELKSSIKVLGKDHQIADGAAFLAYQTRCPVAWCMIARDDDRFVPVIRSMQVGDETYEAFKARFFQFYAEQIEQIITGDPRNLTLKAQWAPPPGKRSPGAARRLGRDAR